MIDSWTRRLQLITMSQTSMISNKQLDTCLEKVKLSPPLRLMVHFGCVLKFHPKAGYPKLFVSSVCDEQKVHPVFFQALPPRSKCFSQMLEKRIYETFFWHARLFPVLPIKLFFLTLLKQLFFSVPRTSNNCNNSTFLGRFSRRNSSLCRLIFTLYWNVAKEAPALEEEN